MDTPSSTVGPGIGAFIAFFLLALFLWLLMRNMNGRMRRMAYREQQRVAELEAREAREQDQAPTQTQARTQAQGPGRRGTKRGKRSAEGSPAQPTQAAPEEGSAAQAGPEEPTP
jgi:hypothetical protein